MARGRRRRSLAVSESQRSPQPNVGASNGSQGHRGRARLGHTGTSRQALPAIISLSRPWRNAGINIGGNAMRYWLRAIVLIATAVGLANPSAAKVVKFQIVHVESPAFEGRSFGSVGTYDR